MTSPTEHDGDCFSAALELAVDLLESGPPLPVFVVHGTPIGTGPENDGLRYWHAWVEVGPYAFDKSNGKEATWQVPREHYYEIGQLTEDHVYRYTVMAAFMNAKHSRVCGPWLPGWRDLCDV